MLENYLECYHCATAHRAYARLHTLEALNAKMLARAEAETGVAGIAHDHYQAYGSSPDFGYCACTRRYALYDGFRTGSRGGEPVAPLMGEFTGYDGGAGDFQLGPLAFMLNYPNHCVLYRFTPRGIDYTDIDLV